MKPDIQSDTQSDTQSDKDYKAAMDTAIRLLCRRRHTSYEIEQKLAARKVNKDCIKAVISKCRHLNYINDKETALQYFQELKNKGCGCLKIRSDMKKKGITQEQIEDIFSKFYNDNEELETARKALQKNLRRFNREKDHWKKKEKIYRFLCYKGFTGSIISKVISELIINDPDTND